MTGGADHVRRIGDQSRRERIRRFLIRENFYRDIWLLIITGLVLVSLLGLRDSVRQINSNRHEVLFQNCLAQNARNLGTKSRLDTLVAGISDPREKARAERNKAGTIALIDALAPYRRDCRAYVEQQLQSSG
jgi:hypothetical protein